MRVLVVLIQIEQLLIYMYNEIIAYTRTRTAVTVGPDVFCFLKKIRYYYTARALLSVHPRPNALSGE